MTRKLLIPLLTFGIFLFLINCVLIVLYFVGKVDHNPILETIGILLILIYGIDTLRNNSGKLLYFLVGMIFLIIGISM
ncbi:hypothetical protein [Staphylococcus canis]|uniref:Uncharacterized protein n=1 Tax=Staphylococcus canis TaxID=2724942 RepID=A0ABS0TAK2_9STAP|nr:hypothetical protein [Staphylococcus canis]MBI5975457.1 hypothetical protein [Staphylococcus canis]